MDALGPELGVFRASMKTLWQLAGFLTAVLLALVIARIVQLDPFSWQRAALALGSLLLIPVLVFGLLAPFVWIYRVRVHHLGLRAFNTYGRFFSVSWPTITEVHRLDFPALPYLRICTTEAGVELVIPSFLARQKDFEQLVIRYAGAENPLSRHFAKAA